MEKGYFVLLLTDESSRDSVKFLKDILKNIGIEGKSVSFDSLRQSKEDSFWDNIALILAEREFVEEIVEMLKERGAMLSIPVIVFGEDNEEKMAQYLEKGVEDCLNFSVASCLIEARIRNALKRKLYFDSYFTTMQELINKDALTGCWNHSHFYDLLRLECARCKRKGEVLSVVMIDVDHFKRINDQWGHPIGDRVIKTVAYLLKENLREGDIIARYGGEEFGILLPETDRILAFKIAERIRKNIFKSSSEHFKDLNLVLSISAGISVYPEDAASPEECVELADRALYQSKRYGRNRIESVRPVTFTLETEKPYESIFICGDFNGWAPRSCRLKKVDRTLWKGTFMLPTGKNRYKFLGLLRHQEKVREHWFLDPANDYAEADQQGHYNSIVFVEGYPISDSSLNIENQLLARLQ